MMLPRTLFLAIANAEAGLEARRVFNLLCAKLNTADWVCASQSEIAAILNMKRSCVSRAIRDLERVEVIFRGPKVGRSYTYRINPNFGWKGSAKNHNAALKERMKERGMSVVTVSGSPAEKDDETSA